MVEKSLASNRRLWLFAIGQLGWFMLSGIISNWLVIFYQPSDTLLDQGQLLLTTQGAVFAGLNVIGMLGELVFIRYRESTIVGVIESGEAKYTGTELDEQ